MASRDAADPEELLRRTRADQGSALGQLLELYRGYLALLARVQIGRRLQSKVDAADLVQETFLEAHRNFARFKGTTEAEIRRLAPANPGGKPCHAPAPLSRHAAPGCTPGA